MIVPYTQSTKRVRILLLSCAFFSGAAGLSYEILWNRNLLLVFGSTTEPRFTTFPLLYSETD